MRIGFITQLLWSRYGAFWTSLLADAGAEIILPQPDAVAARLADGVIGTIPAVSFKLAAAQALALAEVEYLVVPVLNAESDVQRGSAQDPWIADFPDTLVTTLALPSVIRVPVSLEGELDTLVLETLTMLMTDQVRARRVWERHRMNRRVRYAKPRLPHRAAGQQTVAVLAQPWLLIPPVLARLDGETTHYVYQQELDPAKLRAEGWRVEPRLIETDSEVLGAARYFGRRGNIDGLHLIVDQSSGADLWLLQQVRKMSYKPLTVSYLQALLEDDETIDRLLVSA